MEVPWSRPGSGFTLVLEAMILATARELPVRALARMVGEHDTRLWRVIRRHDGQAAERPDLGVDEVRREEVKTNPLLKKTRYLWMRNPSSLKQRQSQQLESLASTT
ncbi:helix-turn-helix domain-containing protein [Limnochorda pilosa]|uniref:Transposase n=1 Tax=Limnochorda pilosa TaxID=1555112 RepID=A0A0K2SQ90_LIMPI|nr:helix-turn-helix domain-containing protein [Limnochorda pilosa]BAS29266.1 transposase [Limnochorda pilosa]